MIYGLSHRDFKVGYSPAKTVPTILYLAKNAKIQCGLMINRATALKG